MAAGQGFHTMAPCRFGNVVNSRDHMSNDESMHAVDPEIAAVLETGCMALAIISPRHGFPAH